MITKTLNLDDAYSKLFDEIREKSNGAIDINSVEGFFGNIIEISALDNGNGKKYLRLPLDEPMFEIDANTRKIDIPNDFKSNGLSVQGDHLAETVYFVIDRYFDYMDLSNTDVTINWKMGSETGKTQNFTMSADVVPGCIVFGWPVDNIITQKSGALTFAVEFCRKDGSNVLYDFNTLPATINIKDGLVIDDVEAEVLDDDILAALTNSQFGEGEAAVGDVTWLTGDGHGLVRNLASEGFVPAEFSSIINLDTEIVGGEPSSSPIDLYAQGFVDSSSDILYFNMSGADIRVPVLVAKSFIPAENRTDDIIYYLEDGTVASDEDILDEEVDLFVLAPLSENLKYYVKINDNPPAYRLASSEQLAAFGTENEVALYMLIAKISISEAGSYAIKAQGQKVDQEGRKIGAGATITSDVITVPAVQAPSAINVEVSQLEELEEGYSFDEEASANVVFLGDEGGELTAHAVVDDFGALQFVWQKKVGEDTSFSNVVDEAIPYKNVNEDILEVSEAGEYKVLVKNFKNGGLAPEVASEIIIASPLAGKITSAKILARKGNGEFEEPSDNVAEYNSAAGNVQGRLTLRISDVVIDGQEGELSYEWYKQQTVDGQVVSTLVNSANDYIITSGEGRYLPVVKNIYNGSIYTYQLSPIMVDDSNNNN